MRRNMMLITLAATAILGSACGGGSKTGSNPTTNPPPSQGGTPTPSAPCSPSGSTLSVTAKNIAFDVNCLAAPDGQAFTINFDNQDAGTAHTVSIYTDSSASTSLFKGSAVTGPSMHTYQVSALQPGTYFFRCDIHPTRMFGTFVVSG